MEKELPLYQPSEILGRVDAAVGTSREILSVEDIPITIYEADDTAATILSSISS